MALRGDFAERLHVGVFLHLQEAGDSQSESSSSLTIQRYEAALLFLKRLLLLFQRRISVDNNAGKGRLRCNRQFLKMCLGVLLSRTRVHLPKWTTANVTILMCFAGVALVAPGS